MKIVRVLPVVQVAVTAGRGRLRPGLNAARGQVREGVILGRAIGSSPVGPSAAGALVLRSAALAVFRVVVLLVLGVVVLLVLRGLVLLVVGLVHENHLTVFQYAPAGKKEYKKKEESSQFRIHKLF
jgi:hypothetical protein